MQKAGQEPFLSGLLYSVQYGSVSKRHAGGTRISGDFPPETPYGPDTWPARPPNFRLARRQKGCGSVAYLKIGPAGGAAVLQGCTVNFREICGPAGCPARTETSYEMRRKLVGRRGRRPVRRWGWGSRKFVCAAREIQWCGVWADVVIGPYRYAVQK